MENGHFSADSLFEGEDILFVNIPIGWPLNHRATFDRREEEQWETRSMTNSVCSQHTELYSEADSPRIPVNLPRCGPVGWASEPVDPADELGLGSQVAEVSPVGRQSEARPGPGPMDPGFRLRRHGRLTNQMERAAAEALDPLFESGGQTSSRVVGTWIRLIREAKGVKLARGERVTWWQEEATGDKPGKVGEDWMIELVSDGRSQLFSLVAYTSLSSYVCFRQRTAELVSALRTRAVQKLKEMNYPEHLSGLVVPGTVSLAMQILPHESRAWDSMGGEAGWRSGRTSGWISRRVVPETHIRTGFRVTSVWDRVCVAIAGGRTTRGRALPRASV